MNRNEREGLGKNVRERFQESAGALTGDENLEAEGVRDRAAGAVQERIGRASRKVGEAIEDPGPKIKN